MVRLQSEMRKMPFDAADPTQVNHSSSSRRFS